MTDEAGKKSLIRQDRMARKKKSNFLRAFIVIYIVGYALFFTSNTWYPSNSNLISATKINRANTWGDRRVTLLNWIYSSKQNEMEVQLEIDSSAIDGIKTYTYSALDRKKGYFNVEPVLQTDDFIVLKISGVDRKWSELSLRISIPEEKQTDDQSKSVLKLYTNSAEIDNVNEIKEKTDNEYMVGRLNSKINGYENEIKKLQKTNKTLQETIDSINENITELKEKEVYQTVAEIEETEKKISQANSDIENTKRNIDTNNDTIQEYKERISKAQEEIKTYE